MRFCRAVLAGMTAAAKFRLFNVYSCVQKTRVAGGSAASFCSEPYIMGGVGVSHHDVGDDGTIRSEQGWDPFVQVGLGIAFEWTENVDFRTEGVYRLDFDDESQPGEDDYGDFMLNLGLVVYLGGAPEPVVVEEVVEEVVETPVPDCSTLDDDGDGVNNCDDRCPGSTPGQTVGPDGCPVEPPPEEVMEPQEYKG